MRPAHLLPLMIGSWIWERDAYAYRLTSNLLRATAAPANSSTP